MPHPFGAACGRPGMGSVRVVDMPSTITDAAVSARRSMRQCAVPGARRTVPREWPSVAQSPTPDPKTGHGRCGGRTRGVARGRSEYEPQVTATTGIRPATETCAGPAAIHPDGGREHRPFRRTLSAATRRPPPTIDRSSTQSTEQSIEQSTERPNRSPRRQPAWGRTHQRRTAWSVLWRERCRTRPFVLWI